MLTSREVRGTKVRKHNGKKAGTVREVLFAPATQQVVGYIVGRGDLLLMIKRKDRFLAFDRAEIAPQTGFLVAQEGKGVWDGSALKRLGISFDDTVVWRGMPVRTEDGRDLGRVADLAINDSDGRLLGVRLSDGAMATALLGRKDISSDLIVSCGRKGILVKNSAVAVEASGGVVDTAATATVIASDRITRGAKTATNVATKGAAEIKKRTSSMLSSFKEEYKKGLDEKK